MTRTQFNDYLFAGDSSTGTTTLIGQTGLSVDSPFVPVFAGRHGVVLTFTGYEEKALIYNLFLSSREVSTHGVSPYREPLHNFLYYSSMKWVSRYFSGQYHSIKGTMFTVEANLVPKIMFTLAFERNYIPVRNNLDFSKIVLIVNKEILLPEHKYIWSKFSKSFTELNITTMFTDSVESWCFRNNFALPNFATLTERLAYLSNVKNFI